jgi:hypothetical protein
VLVRRLDTINIPMSVRIMAASDLWVKSNERRRGVLSQRLKLAQIRTTRNPNANISRYQTKTLIPVGDKAMDENPGQAESA